VILVTLLSVGVAGLGTSSRDLAGAAQASRLIITESDSGKIRTIKTTTHAELRLGNRWNWSQPKVHGSAVKLSPINYERDPGFSAWQITRRSAGSARITAYGRPNCTGCTRHARSFSVQLKVR
jgi:hypothetical protein